MYNDIPERRLEPPEKEYDPPVCPVCGKECDTVYKRDGEILGCDVCVRSYDAWEEYECLKISAGLDIPML